MNYLHKTPEFQGNAPDISASDKLTGVISNLQTSDADINERIEALAKLPIGLQGGVVSILNRAEAKIASNDPSARFSEITQEFIKKVA